MAGWDGIERDEMIAAWLDGMLSPEDAAQFEAELARDPVLAEQVASWATNDALLRAAFRAPIVQGVDDALLAKMNLARPAAPTEPAPAIEATVLRFPEPAANDNPANRRSLRRWLAPAGGLLAAGLAVAVLLPGQHQATEGDPAMAQLASAMEQLPSRSTRTFPDGTSVTPVLSFAAKDGRLCREYTVSGTGGGIVCKGPAGWTVEARASRGVAPADARVIRQAGGPNGVALDAVYTRLGASDPLPAAAEARLIAHGWEQPSGREKNRE